LTLAGNVQWCSVVVLPREVVPGRFYMITRRCTQRQFLLRPDAATNNAFLYLLGEAAQRFQIVVILPSVLSNHHHTIVFDRHGRICEFVEHLHKFVAKVQNALRGRWENFWSSEQVCLVRLVDPADVVDKLVYAATNPVKDRLVERVHHWPGVNGLSALLNQRVIEARRPQHFFRADGPMPERVTLELVIPPELGDGDRLRDELRERVPVLARPAGNARAAAEPAAAGGRAERVVARRGAAPQPDVLDRVPRGSCPVVRRSDRRLPVWHVLAAPLRERSRRDAGAGLNIVGYRPAARAEWLAPSRRGR
jgi:REP element-mobilizing transposase RayT